MKPIDNSHNRFDGKGLKPDRDNIIMRRWFVVLAILMAIVIAVFTGGCEVFKFRKENHSDTTSKKLTTLTDTSSQTGGSVKKEETKSKEENEWFKMTLQYLKDSKPGDPVNNIYPAPATIIYEGGKGSKEETKTSIDSSFYLNTQKLVAMALDSMSRKMDSIEKTKHVETKGLGLLAIVLIGVGLIALNKGFTVLGNRYTITKKQIP